VVEWVAAQPWADRERMSLLGFSLGAIAVPASQRLVKARGLRVGWTVLAYGGANIGDLVRHHPRVRPDWARPMIGWLAAQLFSPLDPAEHLPHLSGRFLVIGGTDDQLIRKRSAQLMHDLVPEPKTILQLSGQHIGVGKDQMRLLKSVLQSTEDWLREQGAINHRQQ
jgi:pimeloyl-ACP methyl ester carboxylesterase